MKSNIKHKHKSNINIYVQLITDYVWLLIGAPYSPDIFAGYI